MEEALSFDSLAQSSSGEKRAGRLAGVLQEMFNRREVMKEYADLADAIEELRRRAGELLGRDDLGVPNMAAAMINYHLVQARREALSIAQPTEARPLPSFVTRLISQEEVDKISPLARDWRRTAK